MTIPQISASLFDSYSMVVYFSAASRNCSSSKPILVHLCTTIVPSKRNHMSIAPSTFPLFLGSETRPNRRVTEPWTETYPERELEPSTSWTRKQRVVPQERLPIYLGGPAKMSLWKCVPAACLADIFHVIFARCICLSQESHLHASLRVRFDMS